MKRNSILQILITLPFISQVAGINRNPLSLQYLFILNREKKMQNQYGSVNIQNNLYYRL